ncbi:hypothetical protein ALI144C_30925 [Actinosynnema sp. ALI-1.44]|uniref:P-loop NTPase fold protein n=1 Tax=Actinosynnema sp. ALI-1.44 TaxID=1933779 RepID=UPI00097C775D|nr:P-loop NTPase fold protein [Actinosynnema sp. ALI-1.44]ONI77844.1 hypothetical protein ALI144C_30925 [Actinosynnema sp. ALI-1.44]
MDIRAAIGRVLRSSEFGHYADHEHEIRRRVGEDAEAINEDVLQARYEYGVGDRAVVSWDELIGLVLRLLLLVPVVAGALAAAIYLWNSPEAELQRIDGLAAYKNWVAGLCAGLFLHQGAAVVRVVKRQVVRWRADIFSSKEAADAYQAALAAKARELVSHAINDVLGSRGVVAFPTYAPRLVELDTSTITPSATVNQVKEFIESHESSAIGLAGNRGSGKSTVLRALTRSPELSPFVTVVASPVKYDAGEFLRRLLHEVAVTINRRANSDDDAPVRRRGNRLALALFWLAGLTGAAMILIKVLPVMPVLKRIDLVLVLGCVLLGAAIINAVVAVARRMASSGDTSLPPDVRRARELLHALQWEVERGTNLKTTVKVQNVLEGSAERTSKDKSRAMSHADLVLALQELLHLFVKYNYPWKHLVVCIDELDKLDQPEHLVSVVNELKDVFHIRGVHFVVTVSTDALRSFESRGLADRDAFDSAFDTVISTRWLTMDESVDVIISRAGGFAAEIAKFCHAWSGGLVRDLLRAARKAVELQKSSGQALTVSEIVNGLIFDDLHSVTLTSLRSLESANPDVASLWELQCMLERGRDGEELCPSAVAALNFTNEAFEVLQAKVRLGLHLINLAGTSGDADAALIQIGNAMGKIAGPKPMRDNAVTNAVALTPGTRLTTTSSERHLRGPDSF